jgi:hypothetical protein
MPQALHLDWRLGLRWFECCLGCHDYALNLGNWAYNAGVVALHTLCLWFRWVPCTKCPPASLGRRKV